MNFEEIEHTADAALRFSGANLTELLMGAATGITHLMVADVSRVSMDIEKIVELEAIDAEELLVDWLSEVAYWAESEMIVFKQFRMEKVSDTHLRAKLFGGKASGLEKHIKAVTYHNLKIEKTPKGLEATVVFDV